MNPAASDHRQALDRPTRNMLVAATAWAAALLPAAVWLPVASVNTPRPGPQPMRSLTAVDGDLNLAVAAIPLAVSVLVWACLRRHRGRPDRAPLLLAWIAAGALALAGAVGTLTILIGICTLPTAALLLAACGLSRGSPGARPASQGWR